MTGNKKILLIQPRHNYAPPFSEKELGHIYLPTSLLTIAAILNEIAVETKIVDENIRQSDYDNNLVGINLLGAPYIPIALDIEKKLKTKYGDDFLLLIGGQVVERLTDLDFKSLFTKNTLNGNSTKILSEVFNIDENRIPKKENVSLIKVYNLIDNETLKSYLSHEFGFYLSQGCQHSCSFCAANRTILIDGKIKRVSEVYRNINIALNDLEYLIQKAISFKLNQIQIYLSNLDLFQNPLKLLPFAEGVVELIKRYPSLIIRLRGLSTSRSFLKVHRDLPYIIQRMADAGLEQIGFGIDGATAEVYKKTRKPQNVQESLDTIRICREVYNITPETLMVFGHNNIEDEKALKMAVKFCQDMQNQFGAVPRPHIAKDIVPCNDGWMDHRNEIIRQQFYKNPLLFQNLDFTAIPSPITHSNSEFRDLVTKYYKMVCELPNSLTQFVLAELPTMTDKELALVRLHNQERYDI